MNRRRSSILNDVPEDRIIEEFPAPFRRNQTPYYKIDFSEATRNACAKENKQPSSNVKICKIIILGDLAVGKTCIVNRFCRQVFDNNYKATIGVDFEVERFGILGVPFNMQLWDTAGQERFKCIAQSYYRAAHVIVTVFDLTNLRTLAHSQMWLQEALGTTNTSLPLIFVVGAKKDLLSEASYTVVEKEAMRFARASRAEYWAVSSKTGENIKELFFRIAALSFDDYILKETEQQNSPVSNISSDLISFKNNLKNKCAKGQSGCQSFCGNK